MRPRNPLACDIGKLLLQGARERLAQRDGAGRIMIMLIILLRSSTGNEEQDEKQLRQSTGGPSGRRGRLASSSAARSFSVNMIRRMADACPVSASMSTIAPPS